MFTHPTWSDILVWTLETWRVAMTVFLDWASVHADDKCPSGTLHCTFCGDKIQPPFMHWHCYGTAANGDDIDICMRAGCCDGYQHGLVADMVRLHAIKKASDPAAPSLLSVQ
jgi:hypothetical protein